MAFKNVISKSNQTYGNKSIKAVFMGVLSSLLILVLTSLIMAFVYLQTNISEDLANIIKMIILTISMLTGGIIAARISGSKGIFHGLAVGIIVLIIATAATIFGGSDVNIYSLIIKGVIIILASTIGGILGVR